MTSPEEAGPDPVVLLIRRVRATFTRRLSAAQRVTLIALALILGQLAFRAWATAGSWFMWDDYIFLSDVARGNDGWDWVFHSHYSLFMPVSFLLVKLVGGAGLSWAVIATQILLMQLLASLTCWWMLRTLFGDRLRILVPLVFYLASPLTMPTVVWWSVAINQLPHHIAICGAVAAHVTYCRSRRLVWAVVATAFLVLGFGSYIKAPLIVVLLVAITFCWFAGGTWRQRARTMLSSWPAWALYGASTLAYLWVWQHQQIAAAPRQSCELPGAVRTSIVDTLGTGMTGGPWTWRLWTGGIDPFIAASHCVPQVYRGDPLLVVGGAPQSLLAPPLFGLILAWVLLLSLVFYRWSRYRNALLSLWFMVPYVGLSAVLVYLGRAGTFGSQVSAREIRYFSDLAIVGAIALGAALMPVIGSVRSVERREEPYLRADLRKPVLAAVALIYLVGSLYSSITYVAPWHETRQAREFPERVFMGNVQAALQAMDPDDLPVRIADVALPTVVANPVIYPYNLPSRKLAPWSDRIRAVTAGTDISILSDDGHILKATVPDSPRARPGPVEGCGYLVQQARKTVRLVPVIDTLWWMRIDYLAGADGELEVWAGNSRQTVPVERGLHSAYVQTTGAYDSVQLRARGDFTVCVDNVHVGNIQGQDATP